MFSLAIRRCFAGIVWDSPAVFKTSKFLSNGRRWQVAKNVNQIILRLPYTHNTLKQDQFLKDEDKFLTDEDGEVDAYLYFIIFDQE